MYVCRLQKPSFFLGGWQVNKCITRLVVILLLVDRLMTASIVQAQDQQQVCCCIDKTLLHTLVDSLPTNTSGTIAVNGWVCSNIGCLCHTAQRVGLVNGGLNFTPCILGGGCISAVGMLWLCAQSDNQTPANSPTALPPRRVRFE